MFLTITEMLMQELELQEEKIYSEKTLKYTLIQKVLNHKKDNEVLNIYKHIINKDEQNIKKDVIKSPLNTLKALYLYTLIGVIK